MPPQTTIGPIAQKRAESLKPVLEGFRQRMGEQNPSALATNTGLDFDPKKEAFRLVFFGEEYWILYPSFGIQKAKTGEECSPQLQLLFFHYLSTADGTPLAGRWIAFRELPEGGFYFQAFQGYAANRLVSSFGNDLEGLPRATAKIGGEPLSLGNLSFLFWSFPRIPLALVYWQGDEEFPPSAQILFDASASHYLDAEGLAHLGSILVDHLLEARER